MKLKTKSRTFRLPVDLLIPDKRAFRIDETENDLILKNQHGLQFSLGKSIVTANGLNSELGCIELNDSIYNRYIVPLIKNANKIAGERLYANFHQVMKNPHIVMKDPECFLIRAKWLCSGVAMSGPISYCLGSLIESWKRSDELKCKDPSGETVFIVKASGGLSGLNNVIAWNPKKETFVQLEKSSVPGGMDRYAGMFSRMQSQYRQSLVADFHAINKLLNACSARSKSRS